MTRAWISNIKSLKVSIMKKQIFSLGLMLAAAFTLTNCAKEMDSVSPNNEGASFEIVASAPQVKTVNDGMKTSWATGDQINLFYAVCDTEEYKNCNAFTVSDATNGKFKGTLTGTLDQVEEYDWYAFYPYNSYISTPANTSCYMAVGSKSNEKQKQAGNSSMAHIAGANYPVAGRAIAVPSNQVPKLAMSHLSSLLEVNVTNQNDDPLTVSSVSFATPADIDIVGTFYINFAGEVPTFAGSGDNYVSNVAELEVANGTALNKGQSATFYLAIKPFTAAANSTLTLSVNGYAKEINLENAVDFKSGKIKTLNFGYDYVAPQGQESYTWDLSKASHASNSTTEVKWTSDCVNMTLSKGSSSTNANNYLGGTNAHTRVYKDQVLKFDLAESVTLKKIEIDVVSSYVDELEGATWTNATASASGNTMIVKPTDESKSVSVTFSAATRFTAITVHYVLDANYVPPTLESIRVDSPKIEYNVGDSFEKPNVFAVYDNGNEVDVTSSAVFTGFNSTAVVTSQTITVTYEGKTTSYTIAIEEAPTSGDEGVKTYKEMFSQYKDTGTSNSKAVSISGDACSWTGVGVTTAYWANFTWGSYSSGVSFLKPGSADAVYLVSEQLSGGVTNVSIAAAANATNAKIKVSVIDVDNNNSEKVLGTVSITAKKTKFTGSWTVSGVSGNYKIKIYNNATTAYVNVTDIQWSKN